MEHFHTSKDIQILSNLGLSEKEAQIYLSAVSTGGGTIADLAEAAQIERTGIYYHIQNLLDLKLIKTVSKGKRTLYLPSDPNRLKIIANKQQKAFEGLFPALEERYSRKASKSIIRNYEGEDQINPFYDDVYQIIKSLQPPDNTLSLLATSYYTVAKASKHFFDYSPPQERLDITSRAILPKSRKVKKAKGLENQPYIMTRYNLPPAELKFITDKYIYPSSVVILKNHIILYDWRNLNFSINENQNNAQTWQAFFNLVWDNIK